MTGKSILRSPSGIASILITLVVVWLHFSLWSGAGGFWRDEVNLINLSARPTLADMSKDSFPLLMPVLVRAWTSFGPGGTDPGLRLLGLLIGLGIPMTLWLAAWQARRSPPLVGLVLFGFSSTLIMFGDSLRAYGLGTLLIMLTAVMALRQATHPSWRRTLWLALLATTSVQALFNNAVLVGAICLGAAIACACKKNYRGMTQVLLAGFTAAVSLLPYFTGMIAGRDSAAVIRSGLKSWRFFSAFQDTMGFPMGGYIYVWGFLAAALAVLAVVAVFKKSQDEVDEFRVRQIFSGVTVFLALAGYVFFLWLAAFPSQSWYLLPMLGIAAIGFEAGLPPVKGLLCVVVFGLAVATAVIAAPAAHRELQNRYTNVDMWSGQLSESAVDGDYIVVTPWFCGITFDHYFRAGVDWQTIPPLSDHKVHRYDLVRTQIQDTNVMNTVYAQATETLRSGHRVWVLSMMGLMDVPEGGTVAPASLPPAPLPQSGWSEAPYTYVWNSQLAHLLGDHAKQFQRVKNPTAGQGFIENTELFVAEGWRDQPTPVAP
jgi:heme exporter protein D